MKNKLKIIVCVIIVLNCACVRIVKKVTINGVKLKMDSNDTTSVQASNYGIVRTFFDSVSSKMILSIKQIKYHTIIDKNYIDTNAVSSFLGDTIYYPNSAHPIVILRGYGFNCSDKFLLVYDRVSLKNTGFILAGSQCDEDDAMDDYTTLDYAVQNEKQFYTEETYNKKNKGHKTKVTITDQYYQIDKNGKIHTMKSKIKSVSYNDPDEDGD